ncbi:MAG: ribosomal protein S11 [Arcticibacterium sp.]|jgi:ribosomal protein S11
MKTNLMTSVFLVSILVSCSTLSDVIKPDKLGGDQSPIGEVGNTFSLGLLDGADGFDAEVVSLDGGVSSIKASLTITDAKLLEIAKSIPGLTWNGNTAEVTRKYKITEEGIQNIYDDTNFTLVRYSDEVGDSYSAKHNGDKITRTIKSKSTEDDYDWSFFNIKVMKIEETGRKIAGVNKIEYIVNHKFSLVGVKVYFEDGSSKEVLTFSKN